MKIALKHLLRRTPIYPPLRDISQKRALRIWENNGRSTPPPHIIKQQAIRELAEKFQLTTLIETGTFLGDMVEAMKDSFTQLYSIELSNELYTKAKQRFAGDDRITIIHGDSGVELGKLTADMDEPALFWLDGHYSAGVTAQGAKNTPIFEELAHIFSSPQKGNVILIDDARCFGTDPTYPSMDALREFIDAQKQDMNIEVVNDAIRIVPCT